jgi:hypothetical protein
MVGITVGITHTIIGIDHIIVGAGTLIGVGTHIGAGTTHIIGAGGILTTTILTIITTTIDLRITITHHTTEA